jgi:[methyl-Co(III) methanol-specific corrinoid protein]:coenzyme M methyltransferase
METIPVMCMNQTGTVETMKRINVYWPEAHFNSEKMAILSLAGHTILGFDSVRVPFDNMVEAEAIGAKLLLGEWYEFPEVEPIKEKPSYYKFPSDPFECGRIHVVLRAVEKLKRLIESRTPIIVGITGPFSTFAYAFGLKRVLMWTLKEPEEIQLGLLKLTEFLKGYIDLLKHNADIICIEENVTSPPMLSPSLFNRFVIHHLEELINTSKRPVVLHMCGNILSILQHLQELKIFGLSVDRKTDLDKIQKRKGIKIVGNIDPYAILLNGNKSMIEEAVKKAIEAGVDILAPGCSLSPFTPNRNIQLLKKIAITYLHRIS